MRPALLRPDRGHGFSLIELAVVTSIIAVVTGLLVGAAHDARNLASDVRCLSNLRQISVALRLYMLDFNALPNDHPQADLAASLAHFLDKPGVLTCPEDHKTPGRSYDPFYVARWTDKSARFVLGCPRHNGNRSALNLMSESSVQYFDLANVTFTPQESGDLGRTTPGSAALSGPDGGNILIAPGDAVTDGSLNFEDGSRLTVSGKGRVVLLQSFRKSNGVLYTIVKIITTTKAEVDVEVMPGSQFEVITPAAIAGVRGTKFIVCVETEPTGGSSTTIDVREGAVWVAGRDANGRSSAAVDVRAGRRVKLFRAAARRRRRVRAKGAKK